ncbi:hypothetical protein SAMN06265221_12832 [Paracoccus laeviglucosivorans]|uniref:Uncharacterized protein n=1 Tax=Paracoccus laeviglucosivorans TaxID=1197861 RepID=A0A521FN26_9RHOB|nr:hypothetical protein SAMN06265221_12832 [Paracoccus laeviglucosivorans]
MSTLPIIENADTELNSSGFSAVPRLDTAQGHSDFQHAVKQFADNSKSWELLRTHAGRFEAWEKAEFVRFEGCNVR